MSATHKQIRVLSPKKSIPQANVVHDPATSISDRLEAGAILSQFAEPEEDGPVEIDPAYIEELTERLLRTGGFKRKPVHIIFLSI